MAARGSGESTGPPSSARERNARSDFADRSEPSPSTRVTEDFSPPARPTGEEAAPPAVQPSRLDTLTEREPAHVSEEPALVEDLAEPGAEDGAGAEVHIHEPRDGYARMNAKQIMTRLGAATPAEHAAVQLYEGSHRRRQPILNAVQRH